MILESAIGKWMLAIGVAALGLLAPIHILMISVGFLIAADLVTGVAAAIKRGDKITSKALSRTIYKCLGYQLAVISGFALEFLVPGGLPIAKLIAAAVGLVEGKSLLENVKAITGVDLTSVLAKVQQKRDE